MMQTDRELPLQEKPEKLSCVKEKKIGNRGSSLVEVLVGIAVLAIICVPLFSGFRTSSYLNSRAHYTQAATIYAQSVIEDMKRMSVKEFTEEILNETDEKKDPAGTITREVDTQLYALFPGYEEELFTIIRCRQKNIRIDGKAYDLEAVYDPTPYSAMKNDSSESAADVNVFGIAGVQGVDGLKFPVISAEINMYEGTGEAAASFLKDLWWMVPEKERNGINLGELYDKTKKTVDVIIRGSGSSSIKVVCDVTYEVPEYSVKKTYNVYNSSYELVEKKDEQGNFAGYLTGGRIYIFAKAYQDQSGAMGGRMIRENTIKITNYYVGQPLDIYLVRGHYSEAAPDNPDPAFKKGVNFDHVILSDGNSEKEYSSLTPGEILTGEILSDSSKGYQNMNFRTNIKGTNLARMLTTEDVEQTIGKDVSKLRCYQLTVTLTDTERKETAAQVVSAKEH